MTPSLILTLVFAQSAMARTAPDLDRIRKALEAPAAPLSVRAVPREGAIFRLTVEGIDLGAAWKDRSMVPPDVHTWMRAYSHEHMEMVTPGEFAARRCTRSASLSTWSSDTW